MILPEMTIVARGISKMSSKFYAYVIPRVPMGSLNTSAYLATALPRVILLCIVLCYSFHLPALGIKL